MNEELKQTSHYDRCFNFCGGHNKIKTLLNHCICFFDVFPAMALCSFASHGYFWINIYSLVWKKERRRKSYTRATCTSCILYTLLPASIYVDIVKRKRHAVGRKLVMGTETMKVPRGYNVMYWFVQGLYCAIEREYFDTCIVLWSANIYESQMKHVVFGRINSNWTA